MQKVASAGMGNPKERKECPICGKTLYDRSTWNRHMRIHTGMYFNTKMHIALTRKLTLELQLKASLSLLYLSS